MTDRPADEMAMPKKRYIRKNAPTADGITMSTPPAGEAEGTAEQTVPAGLGDDGDALQRKLHGIYTSAAVDPPVQSGPAGAASMLDKFEQALAEGAFDMRKSVGQQWSKYIAKRPDENKTYKTLTPDGKNSSAKSGSRERSRP